MPTHKTIFHQEQNKPLIQQAKWCNTFATKLQGFMFKKTLTPDEALVLVERSENRVNTAIHMLFMNFDLGVLWVNAAGQVVDKTHAKRWKLQYTPAKTGPIRHRNAPFSARCGKNRRSYNLQIRIFARSNEITASFLVTSEK